MKKVLISLLASLAIPVLSSAIEFTSPTALDQFSASSVFSIRQDNSGALWINSDYGLFRYNGHKLDFINRIGGHRINVGKGDFVYILSSHSVFKYNIKTLAYERIKYSDVQPKNSVSLAEGDSLIIGADNKLITLSDNTVHTRVEFDNTVNISSLHRSKDGDLLVGTVSSGLLKINGEGYETVLQIKSRISDIYTDGEGQLWVGTADKGVFCIDQKDNSILHHFSSVGKENLQDVRTFWEDKYGTLLFGSVNGLFRREKDGAIFREPLNGIEDNPVCEIFADRDGGVWVSSYYNGVFYANLSSDPFRQLSTPPDLHYIKGMVEDKFGRIWVATDKFGLFCYYPKEDKWKLIPGSKGIKFQCAYYDERTNSVWSGEFTNSVERYDLTSGRFIKYLLPRKADPSSRETIKRIIRYGEDMILAGNFAAYSFNPEIESEIVRKAGAFSGMVFDVKRAPDGNLWIGGYGLFKYTKEGHFEKWKGLEVNGNSLDYAPCRNICFTPEGDALISVASLGTVVISNGKTTLYNSSNTGIPDDNSNYAAQYGPDHLIIGHRKGISILNTDNMVCQNYEASSKSSLKSIKTGPLLTLSNGDIIIAADDHLETISRDRDRFLNKESKPISIDHIDINRQHYSFSTKGVSRINLKHYENNLSIDIASFDYSSITASKYYCRLEGSDNKWHEFELSKPIEYTNLSPGRYIFRTMVMTGKEQEKGDAEIEIVISPVWYGTLAFKMFVILILIGSILTLTRMNYKQRLLSAQLAIKEKENIERTKYFVDMSNKLRTPLNLIIGQFENFFKNFGSRTQGVESLESIYQDAKAMRKMITEYVDTQNDEIETREATANVSEAVSNAKFINAAIGAVERNLFSSNLNVSFLCEELNMGKTKLSETMQATTGMSPREFIEDAKLKHAVKMIQDGTFRVNEISDSLGFSSPRYFSQRFKLKFGCTPTEFKERS